jgi:alpha-L-rhamnosidase
VAITPHKKEKRMKQTRSFINALQHIVKGKCRLHLLFVSGLSLAFPGVTPAATVDTLRCEYLDDPLGIETAQPRLSWSIEESGEKAEGRRLKAEDRGRKQAAYQVLVASSAEVLKKDKGDLWDSGRVDSDQSTLVEYRGKPLASGAAYYWKVRVWLAVSGREESQKIKPSGWSLPAQWTMGLLQPDDWTAQWISFRDTTPLPDKPGALLLPPARHYRKEFSAKKQVARATLYSSALGLCEMHLNGRKVGDALLEPGWSDYLKRAYYRTTDVTPLVKQGSNTVGAVVTDGWYAGYVGYALLCGYGPNHLGRNLYGKTPALLAQLQIDYADGTCDIVCTDPSWQVSGAGPFREADIIMGESYDARLADPSWCELGGGASWKWESAIPAGENGSLKAAFHEPGASRQVELGFQRPARLQAYPAPPVRVTQELKAKMLSEPAPSVYVFDLGQNFAGTVRLKVKGAAGTRVQIRYAEMLHKDGRLMTENLRKARATDFYTLRGAAGGETWSPTFTYHGFQFVELTGLPSKPDLEAVTGLVIHSDTPLVGEFSCSDPVMTRFAQNAKWTQRANFVEVPTDCPQRDERLGWMGDAQVYVRTASYFADIGAFYTKWLDDVEEAQRDSGPYPDYSPYPMAHGKPGATFGTAWTDAGIICPWTIWQVYGDTRVISRHWNSMQRFMAWRLQCDPQLQGVRLGNEWGDWLNVNESTPIEYIDLCYHALDAKLMADMAEAIGAGDDAAKYRKLFSDAAASFQKRYLKPDGSLGVDTQSAYVLALWAGLIPESSAAKSASFLAAKIRKNDSRMATGFLGTKPLLGVLTKYGQHDLAVQLFLSRRYPSWGYEVVNGASSVWERWDSYTTEFGFNGASGKQNASMNSFSHYSFGAVMEWAFRDLAGIDTQGAGFGHLLIRPGPSTASAPDAAPLTWVKASYNHPRGRVVSNWTSEGGNMTMEITIPANTTATVYVPATDGQSVTESGKPVAQAAGLKFLRMESGAAVFEAESGAYHFVSTMK